MLPGLEEPPEEELGSDVVCACAAMTRHAALMTAILSSCFLINLPFFVTALLTPIDALWRRNGQMRQPKLAAGPQKWGKCSKSNGVTAPQVQAKERIWPWAEWEDGGWTSAIY